MKKKNSKEVRTIARNRLSANLSAGISAAALTMLLFTLSGCNTLTPAVSDSENSDVSKAAPVKVTLVLDWIVNTNHTGIYVAEELGYFEEEGLEVEIVQAPEMNFVEMVGMNAAQFGICGQEQLTQARVTGDVPVVAIGAILQHNTSGFAAPADRNIKSPKDFEGKKYSGWGTPLEERFIETLMKKSGGDFSRVEMRMMGATDYFASMETEADFAWIYYGWDGIGAKVRNYPLDFILLQDVDPVLDFYSPLFISNEETISGHPELVQKFMDAVSRGYQYAVGQPEEACDLLLKSTPETDRTHALKSIEYLSQYFLDEDGGFGSMDQAIWENFSTWMFDNKLIGSPLQIEDSYTNEFLPQ
ncbi:MAG: ABC transporter substrate-binding protein [Saccharofermentanales bacterium]